MSEESGEKRKVHVWTYNGEEYCDEERAIAEMLNDSDLCLGCGDDGKTFVFVNCSDVFAWGCADGEDLPHSEIKDLYKMFIADKQHGATRWCCIKRNEQPQAPVKRMMQEAGSWDSVLESLPANGYDARYAAERAAKLAQEPAHAQ